MKAHLIVLAGLTSACAVIDGVSGEQQRSEDPTKQWQWHGPVKIGQSSGGSDVARLAVDEHGKAWVTWYQWDNSAMTGTAWLTSRSAGGDWASPVAVPTIPGWSVVMYPQIAVGASGDPVLAFQADDAVSGGTRSVRAVRLRNGLNVNVADIVRVDSVSSDTPQLSQAHSLTVDEAGNAVLVWGETDGVYASASTNSGAWSSPQSLENTSVGWPTLDVSAGSSGHAFAGWSSGSSVKVRSLDISGGSLVPDTLETLATGTNLPGPIVATRGSKTLMVWSDGAALHSRFYDGLWSGAVQTITDQLSYYPDVSLALNDNGQAVLVWRHAGGGDSYTSTLSAAYFNGTEWSAPETISVSGPTRKCWWASVGLNNKGVAVASWADFDEAGTYTRIWANILRFNGNLATWGGPVTIDEATPSAYLADKPENVRNNSVGMDPEGKAAYVIYKQSKPDMTPETWVNWLE